MNESIADIVAQMRGRGEDGRMDRRLWLDYADRIEAAWKRDEERAVEHATRHAEAVARDNCRDCIHNPNGKNIVAQMPYDPERGDLCHED